MYEVIGALLIIGLVLMIQNHLKEREVLNQLEKTIKEIAEEKVL
jgi:hypothetical protein